MTISVVIATFNRAVLLDECLQHLAHQRFAPGDEVIVVDNGSTDATEQVLGHRATTFPVPLRRIVEHHPGKSHALTAGLAVASGDIIALTDDDVNVSSGWLGAMRAAFTDPQVALVGGPVAPRWERQAPQWLASGTSTHSRFNAPLALLDYGSAPCALGDRTLLGANMAVRRRVLEQVGGFAPHLGKLRGTLLSGEDHEFCQRVQASGERALYVPDAVVYHWVPDARMRLKYFLSWFYWSGITNAAMEDGQPAGRAWFGVPTYLARRFVSGLVGSAGAVVSGRSSRAVDRALDVAFAAGYASGRWRLVQVPFGKARTAS